MGGGKGLNKSKVLGFDSQLQFSSESLLWIVERKIETRNTRIGSWEESIVSGTNYDWRTAIYNI